MIISTGCWPSPARRWRRPRNRRTGGGQYPVKQEPAESGTLSTGCWPAPARRFLLSSQTNSSYKPRQSGFNTSIAFIFQFLFQNFMAFSRSIADNIVSCTSYQTNLSSPYFCVKPFTNLFLYCQMRLDKSEVTPMYNVPFYWLVSI